MIGTFLKPQLAKSTKDRPDAVNSDEFVAEPKLDGQRLQIHVAEYRTVAAYSRIGRSVLGERGMAWLKEVAWPIERGVLDGEAYAGDGTNLGQANVLEARSTAGMPVSVALFDLLALGDRSYVGGAPWEERRAELEAAVDGWTHERVSLVPVTDDAQGLWEVWVGQFGGEGVMLKRRQGLWVPGKRSEDWIKWKQEITVDVVITGVTDKATYDRNGYRGKGGWALTYGYWSPETGSFVSVGQGVRFGAREELLPFVGRVAECLCAGVMPSGALRHHRFVRWRDDKDPKDCALPK